LIVVQDVFYVIHCIEVQDCFLSIKTTRAKIQVFAFGSRLGIGKRDMLEAEIFHHVIEIFSGSKYPTAN